MHAHWYGTQVIELTILAAIDQSGTDPHEQQQNHRYRCQRRRSP